VIQRHAAVQKLYQ